MDSASIRVIDIAADRAPIALVKAPTLVLHIIPLIALSEQTSHDVTPFHQNPALHRPWNSSGWDRRMTFDGVLLHSSVREDGTVASYSHFYRSGILEADQRLIPHVALEQYVLQYLPLCFKSLQEIGVRPPLSLSLTLIGVRGLRMAMGS